MLKKFVDNKGIHFREKKCLRLFFQNTIFNVNEQSSKLNESINKQSEWSVMTHHSVSDEESVGCRH